MKLIQILFRLLLGISLAASGFIRLADSTGTGMLVSEYLALLGINVSGMLPLISGTALSILEFTVGICLLMRLRLRTMSMICLIYSIVCTVAASVMVSVFSLPVARNAVAALMSLFLFLDAKKRPRLAPTLFEWAATASLAAFAVAIAVDSWVNIPRIDFSRYRVGSDFRHKAEQILPSCGSHLMEKYVAVSIWDISGIGEKQWDEIAMLKAVATSSQAGFVILCNEYGAPEPLEDAQVRLPANELMELLRSNGGAVLLDEGLIVYKCPARSILGDKFAEALIDDPDETIAEYSAGRIFFVCLCSLSLLILLLLVHHLCKVFYCDKKKTK